MRFKGTIALSILLIAGLAFVYFYEIGRKEKLREPDATRNVAIRVDPNDITEISLTYPDRSISGSKKAEKQWEITSSPAVEGEADAWEQLAVGIAGLQRAETVAQNVEDLTPYGLNPPLINVSAKLKDGRTIGFSFGIDNPKKIGRYTKFIDSNDVFLTAPPFARTFTRTLPDLRKMTVVNADWQKVDMIEIRRGSGNVVLRRTGSEWKLADGRKVQSDSVSQMLRVLQLERAIDIVEAPKALSAYGLDKPRLEVILAEGSNEVQRIAFGADREAPEGVYIKSSSSTPVMVLSKSAFIKWNFGVEAVVASAGSPSNSSPSATPSSTPPVVMPKKGSH